jgi:hypothetical protein
MAGTRSFFIDGRAVAGWTAVALSAALWGGAVAEDGDTGTVIPLLVTAWVLSTTTLALCTSLGIGCRVAGTIALTLLFVGSALLLQFPQVEIVTDPRLSATLVIDSLVEGKQNFHIELANLPGPTVTLLHYAYETTKLNDSNVRPADRSHIVAKGSKIALPSQRYPAMTNPPLILNMTIAYEVTAEPDRKFNASYRFFLDHNIGSLQRLAARTWEQSSGTFDSPHPSREGANAFQEPSGTLSLLFPECQPNGEPNIIIIHTDGRDMIVDPITWVAQFSARFPHSTNTKSIEFNFQKNATRMHRLAASWNDQKQDITFMIDGR